MSCVHAYVMSLCVCMYVVLSCIMHVCMYVVHSYNVMYIYVVRSCVCAFMYMCVYVYAYVCMRVRRTFVRIYVVCLWV